MFEYQIFIVVFSAAYLLTWTWGLEVVGTKRGRSVIGHLDEISLQF